MPHVMDDTAYLCQRPTAANQERHVRDPQLCAAVRSGVFPVVYCGELRLEDMRELAVAAMFVPADRVVGVYGGRGCSVVYNWGESVGVLSGEGFYQ